MEYLKTLKTLKIIKNTT